MAGRYPSAWPRCLVPSSEVWRLSGGNRGGGQALDGTEEVVAGASPYWRATRTVPVRTREQILAYRAMIAGLDGRAGTLQVGPWDFPRVPWATDPYGRRVTPSLDRRRGLDATAYADPEARIDALVAAVLAKGVARNGTSATIRMVRGGVVEAGLYFGLDDRLHIVTAAEETIGADTEITFRPWSRDRVVTGAPVNFVTPKCRMRLANDDTGALELQLARFGTITIELVEAY